MDFFSRRGLRSRKQCKRDTCNKRDTSANARKRQGALRRGQNRDVKDGREGVKRLDRQELTRDLRDRLNQVRDGMAVYEVTGARLGTVTALYLGGNSPEARTETRGPAAPGDVVVPVIASTPGQASGNNPGPIPAVRVSDSALPDAVRARLEQTGYVRVTSGGLLPTEYFVTPEQILKVDTDTHRVELKVVRERLISPARQ